MIILESGAVGYNVIGVYRWILPKGLNKVKIFQCLSIHIHAYKIRILGGTERISGHHI